MSLTKDDLQKHRENFDKYDTDKNGKIDQNEFISFWKTIEPDTSDFNARSVMIAIDTNKNGTIEFDEWVDFWTGKTNLNLTDDQAFEFAFRAADANNDGQISLDEFRVLASELKLCEPADAGKAFELVDTDGNGFIDLNEWITACKNNK
eukprot:TRINITY_DN16409_c0_g1_i1.p2 TRINITY_DN16409_c0_g1~~TRINITY_DN16409_c0_g1_i1.p2  ORF type:complete len:149 (+),score=30.53 TRINITY_DN16409_c0_g1_i1:53-499(+)